MAKLYADGWLIDKNPSLRGGGWTVVDEKGTILRRVTRYRRMTNNEAELLGMCEAAKLAMPGDTLCTDSQCIENWLTSPKRKYRHTRPDLARFADGCIKAIEVKKLTVEWTPREENLAGLINEEFQAKGLNV